MEDRQCKICMQYKPLFEFELWGEGGKRSFTCCDCVGISSPVQPSEFALKFGARPIKTCCVDDCDEPVHQGCPKCYRHMLEQWAEAETLLNSRKPSPRKIKTTCAHEGCSEPRYVSPGGQKHKFCIQHRNEYQRERLAHKPKPMTEAQRHAGFDRDETKARSKAEVSKVCIIDHNTKVASFMDVIITAQRSIDGLEALPGGFDILLHGNASKGYVTVERGTRPVSEANHA